MPKQKDDLEIARELSPYQYLSRDEWARLRADTPLTITDEELRDLQSVNDPISVNEVIAIYLPLSRLLSFYVEATQRLFQATRKFLGTENGKVPYIIGIAGSVAVGKSTTARVLRQLLSRGPNSPNVDLVTTDGFLLPNAELVSQGLMERKGFPESYDSAQIIRFLSGIKAGERNSKVPVYSHLTYDVVANKYLTIDNPDILIVEGLNVLQPGKPGREIPFVSDFFDFSIYLDAEIENLSRWYVSRFMRLRETAFRDPRSYFHKYADLSDEEARATALDIWTRINLRNLNENIIPTRPRASLILTKAADHSIQSVALRKL